MGHVSLRSPSVKKQRRVLEISSQPLTVCYGSVEIQNCATFTHGKFHLKCDTFSKIVCKKPKFVQYLSENVLNSTDLCTLLGTPKKLPKKNVSFSVCRKGGKMFSCLWVVPSEENRAIKIFHCGSDFQPGRLHVCLRPFYLIRIVILKQVLSHRTFSC